MNRVDETKELLTMEKKDVKKIAMSEIPKEKLKDILGGMAMSGDDQTLCPDCGYYFYGDTCPQCGRKVCEQSCKKRCHTEQK